MEYDPKFYSPNTPIDGNEPLAQLVRWVKKGYGVSLGNEFGNGWTCTIWNMEAGVLISREAQGAIARIRAQSAICDTPEQAIEDLLKVVQP